MTQAQIARIACDFKRRMSNILSAWTRAAKKTYTITCKKGCNHCCYQLAHSSLYEGVVIANRLMCNKNMTLLEKAIDQGSRQEKLTGVENTTTAVSYDPTLQNKAAAAWFTRQEPCAFLENNTCTIYDIRPVACAAYLAVTPPELCQGPGLTQIGIINAAGIALQSMQFDAVFFETITGVSPHAKSNADLAILIPIPLGMAVIYGAQLLIEGPQKLRESLNISRVNSETTPNKELHD